MASAEEVYREAQTRLHRVLGSYLAMEAWKSGADSVVIKRDQLLTFLELKRMKNVRIDWIKEDLKHLFKFSDTTAYTESGNYAELYLSREKFPKGIFTASMNTKQRINKFKDNGLKLVEIELPTETELISRMALITVGVEAL